jgi:hypothetical protein
MYKYIISFTLWPGSISLVCLVVAAHLQPRCNLLVCYLTSPTRPLPVTLGFFFASHFRLPLLLPSAPIDLSGPNLKTSNWINLALPDNTFKLIMIYCFLLPKINIYVLCQLLKSLKRILLDEQKP